MMTSEELNALKEEFAALNKKLAELSEDELKQVSGGLTLKQYNIVMQNISKCLKGILTDEQRSEILDKARNLDQVDYERWAGDYAQNQGFDYNGISSMRIM